MAQVSVAPRRRNRPGRRAQLTFVGLGLTPVMLLLMVFAAIPILGGLVLSLFHYNGLNPQPSFVGLLNFKHLFADDPLFYTTLRNTVIFTVSPLLFTKLKLARLRRGAAVKVASAPGIGVPTRAVGGTQVEAAAEVASKVAGVMPVGGAKPGTDDSGVGVEGNVALPHP